MSQILIEKAGPAVVKIICPDIDSSGTGFLIGPDGYTVTNNHVIGEIKFTKEGTPRVDYSENIHVEIDGASYEADIAIDTSSDKPFVFDYAILKIKNFKTEFYLQLGDPDIIKRGDKVICLGYPLDFETMVATDGIVSALIYRQSHRGTSHKMHTILTNALIQFGNSGGPMLHVETSKVIGINTLSHRIYGKKHIEKWLKHSEVDNFPWLKDLTEFCKEYIHSGLNHAVSIKYVLDDPSYSKI
ncbi:S1C family serine protease [Planctomycetota bacterium]